ncbi:hypothetical protein [Motiliproteus sediminis]|uniref:hypothetical protein n=1 Tax=Motiliproteus sediminis TaxID=1468178 RepID=UPI001AEF37DD|nr:hypothetical protein [Motiliproteus sediminis]
MTQSIKPLADIWLELQIVTMDAELSTKDRERLELLLDSLKEHVSTNQERERRVLLKWFSARLGPRLFSNHYRQLVLEFGNLMSTLWTGKPAFHTSDEVLAWMNDELSGMGEDDGVISMQERA